ncbi:MAG: hypothetical protein OEY23_26235 [Acidimicrobiia bacterium]|nr:hypothetical protein [Acidimicrobiia bacterium]
MQNEAALGLTAIVVAGVGAQWLASRLIATPNPELGVHALGRFTEALGRRHVFQLPATGADEAEGVTRPARRGLDATNWGRQPFSADANQADLALAVALGARASAEVSDPRWGSNGPALLFGFDRAGRVRVQRAERAAPPAGTLVVALRPGWLPGPGARGAPADAVTSDGAAPGAHGSRRGAPKRR